jgi:hypothetical protein
VEEALLMDVKQCIAKLPSYVSYLIIFQFFTSLFIFSHELVQILFDIFEDKISLIDDSNNLFEFDDIGMVQFSQCLYLW